MDDGFEVIIGHQCLPVVDPDINRRSTRSCKFQVFPDHFTGFCFLCGGNRILQVQGDDVGRSLGRLGNHLLIISRNVKNRSHDSHNDTSYLI